MNTRERGRVLGQNPADYSLGLTVPAGQLIFISGQVALDSEGNAAFPDDAEQQARRTFQNIQSLLAEAGASLDDVVKLTTFLTDMSRYPDFVKVRREFFQAPFPASSVIGVKELYKPGLLIEIEAIAVVQQWYSHFVGP